MPKIGHEILVTNENFLKGKERSYKAMEVADMLPGTEENKTHVIRNMLEKQARLTKAHDEAMRKIAEILNNK